MRVNQTNISGAYLIELSVHRDNRGFFLESYQRARYIECGIKAEFVQDNRSSTGKGVLRGLHYQVCNPIGHLICVTRGRIMDVGLDLRPNSPTFGCHLSMELTEERHEQLYLPPGVAHGFCTLGECNEMSYKCTEYYYPEDEAGVLWNDPDLGIEWPFLNPSIKPRDAAFPRLRDIDSSRLPRM